VLVTVNADTRNTNQLFERTSADYGESWTAPRRILDSLDTAPAYHPQLRFAAPTLALAWFDGEMGGPESLRMTRRSLAEGEGWARPLSLPVSGVLVTAPFTLTECGSAIALVEMIVRGHIPVVLEARADARHIAFTPFRDSLALSPTTSRAGATVLEVWNGVDMAKRGFSPYWRELSLCGG
jgi:hypothetical protein